MALKQKLMLGAISVMLGALLPGCTADKQPSKEEATLANAAKDVTIPLEAGMKKNPLSETDEVVSQSQEVGVETLTSDATWGDGAFEYDAASNTFRLADLKDKPPQANDAKCGFTCHTIVKTRDYVFTDYGRR